MYGVKEKRRTARRRPVLDCKEDMSITKVCLCDSGDGGGRYDLDNCVIRLVNRLQLLDRAVLYMVPNGIGSFVDLSGSHSDL